MLNRYVTLAVMMNLCLAAGEAEAAEITLNPTITPVWPSAFTTKIWP